jgi:hypothetical protein
MKSTKATGIYLSLSGTIGLLQAVSYLRAALDTGATGVVPPIVVLVAFCGLLLATGMSLLRHGSFGPRVVWPVLLVQVPVIGFPFIRFEAQAPFGVILSVTSSGQPLLAFSLDTSFHIGLRTVGAAWEDGVNLATLGFLAWVWRERRMAGNQSRLSATIPTGPA